MRLRTRLVLALSYVLVLAILALLVPLVVSVRDRVDAEVRPRRARRPSWPPRSRPARPASGRWWTACAGFVRGRVIVVNRRGRLVADSEPGSARGDDYSTRPEIRAALRGRTVQEERASTTLGRRILATAVPVLRGGRTDGAVRITQSVDAVHRAVNRATVGLALIGFVVLLLGLGAGVLIARHVARPLRRLEKTAAAVAAGDLGARATIEGSTEQRLLAATFNDMTARRAAAGGVPARVRRRRLAPAPHAPGGHAAAPRGGAGDHDRSRRARAARGGAARRSTGSRRWSPSC